MSGSDARGTTFDHFDDSMNELGSLLRNIGRSGSENKVKESVNIFCQNETIKSTI